MKYILSFHFIFKESEKSTGNFFFSRMDSKTSLLQSGILRIRDYNVDFWSPQHYPKQLFFKFLFITYCDMKLWIKRVGFFLSCKLQE